MALDIATFRARFPEFEDTEDALVQAKIDEALENMGDIWGDKADLGHGYLAAHLLSSSPYGRQGRRSNESQTTYGDEYRRLQRVVAFGRRVVGAV